ncbi:PAS domain S-box protein [Pantanalinema sp. GBBB05]|uniref:PAS domain-containing hybrid sensor histidine kinase/response regulator n=1 Tax=Pantanalinema sp. GBBB05 TaxID=2604139 RepID=UPI001E148A6B|nr:PAS domain S-box protein [Pantanalinema sp. GBBB05]
MTEAEAEISKHSSPPENSKSVPLLESEELFRLALEASPDGFIILRSLQDITGTIADFIIEYTNPAAAKHVNLTQEKLLGQRLLQLFPDCQTNGMFDRYVTVAETGISETFETLYKNKELTSWLRHVVVKLTDRIAVSFSDITTLKQAELTLHQQEQHFRVALQTAKLGSWEQDLTTNTLICSAQCKANFGLPPEAEFTHDTLFAALHPDDRPRVQAAIQHAIAHRTDYEVEERCYHPDGSLHWLIVRGQIVYDSQGIPSRLVGVTLDITERKRTETELRASQDLFQSFMQHSPIAAFIKDEQGRYLYANSWVERVYQRSQTELLGKTDFELLPLSLAQQFCLNDMAVLASDQPMQILETIDQEDGEHSYMSFKFPFRNAAGERVLAGVAIDISERIQAESALQQREAELRLITNAVPVLISLVDTEQRYHFNNQKYEAWFGTSTTELQGKYLWEVLGQTAYETIRPYVEQALAGQEVTFESRIPYQAGGMRDAVVNYVPHFNQHGKIAGFVALVSDITRRKQAEATLQQSEERLRIAQQAANAGVWDWDITSNRVTWSVEYYHLYGLDPDLIAPSYENWLASIIEADRDRVHQSTRQALEHQTDLNVEFRILHPTQGERWLTAIGQTFYDEHQQPQRMTGIALDITDRKQSEAEREQFLAREQKARQEAEQANRIKDEFLAVLSHELRSPLNPILGWARLLQTRQFDALATTRALETIERNAKLQAQLIDDLLDVSRILRGKMVLNVAPVHLEAVIDAALETVRLSIEAKDITIHKAVVGEVGPIAGDASRLQQIVWNLLSNAVKFTPPSGHIEIRLEQVGNHVQLQIADTGKGITPEFLPHVFEYFRQEDGTTTRKFGGLGLGLAIVRYLTEQHGGSVKAESPIVGLGATFTVSFPLLKPGTARGWTHPESTNVSSATLPLANLRILIVDDQADMRELMSTILQATGAEINVAASAVDALKLVKVFQPDILISDIGMPEVDGYTLLHQLRQLSPDQGGQIPAIALTAYAGELDRQQALAAGFQLHMAKPIEPEKLVQAISRLVQRPQTI